MQHRLSLRFLYLLLALGLLAACTIRGGSSRGGSGGDDDDDDSAIGDDDDTVGDDDDTVGDDDDTVGDDDDTTPGDDDDSTAPPNPSSAGLGADFSSFGTVTVGSNASTTLYIEAYSGQTTIAGTLVLSNSNGWVLTGGNSVTVPANNTITRTLIFQPTGTGSSSTTVTLNHNGANGSVSQTFTGTGGSSVPSFETSCNDGIDNDQDSYVDCVDFDCIGSSSCPEAGNCTDGVDNDGDGSIDCADSQCSGDPACAVDPCCPPESASDDSDCIDTSAAASTCFNDSYCCTGWDGVCADAYQLTYGAFTCSP